MHSVIPHYDNRKFCFILHSSKMCKNARSSSHPDVPGTFTFDQFKVLAKVGAVANEAHFQYFHHPPAFIPRLDGTAGRLRWTGRRWFPWQRTGVTRHLYIGSNDYQLCGEKKKNVQVQAWIWRSRRKSMSDSIIKYENMNKWEF